MTQIATANHCQLSNFSFKIKNAKTVVIIGQIKYAKDADYIKGLIYEFEQGASHIATSISEVNMAIDGVSAAVEEASASTEEISSSADATANSLMVIADAAKEQEEYAQRLKDGISRYNI